MTGDPLTTFRWESDEPKEASRPLGPPPANTVENHRVLAVWSVVIGLVFSCVGIVPGLIALPHSVQVDSAIKQGDYYSAQRASDKTRGWAIAAFLTTGIVFALAVLLRVVRFSFVAHA
jgi:hypothetical protein